MKSIRIYKDDIRTHILRSLFFTDNVLVVGGIVLIAGILYLLFTQIVGQFLLNYYLSSLFVSTVLFLAVMTQKIDNQPIFKIIPRALLHQRRDKQQRYPQMDAYFTDFIIQDNHILRPNSVISIYEIEPYDIALLNIQDREHFYSKIKQVIHMLQTPIQILVRKVPVKSSDYSSHFTSLFNSSTSERESLINSYINDLSDFVDSNQLLITKYYAVISVECNTSNPYRRLNGIKKVSSLSLRFIAGLASCNIQARQLNNQELKQLSKKILR